MAGRTIVRQLSFRSREERIVASSPPALGELIVDRTRRVRRVTCGIVACAAFVLLPLAGSSQVQVPGLPACELEPVTLPLFDATPAAIIAATPASPPVNASAGTTLDAASIETAIEAIVNCISSSDPALRYAVFTNRYLAEQLADPNRTYQPAFEQHLDSGVSTDTPQYAIEAIEQPVPLGDGRVSVVVTLSADGTQYRDRLVLADLDGTWLIDEVELIDPATPGAGS